MERFQVPEDIAVRVPHEAMHATVAAIFEALDCPAEDARRCADTLLYADLRGIDSHGVSNMMPIYVAMLKQGYVNPAPHMQVLQEADATATIDSDRGLGLTIGPQCMDLAIEKARRCGIGAVVATNGRHFGAAAYHAGRALEHDMIGLALTVGGLEVAPTFGGEARVGLNPIGIAVPSLEEPPFVFDASMSSVAGNKMRIAKRLGSNILPGWIATPDGTPIMHESAVPDDFLMLPLGGTRELGSHKGYGLAVMVDILSGLLGGDPPGFEREPGDVSHHFLAYRIDAFSDLAGFKQRMDTYLRGLCETKPAPGHERVLYAGLPEHEAEQERRQRGIPYHPDVIAWFHETANALGASHPLP